MATFLSTTGVSFHLERIISGAKEQVLLISPYLRTNARIREFLAERERARIDIRVVYGKTELGADEAEWLRGRPGIRVRFCKNLHAKCYVNERLALITSMNLHEFSQINNNEMGILVDRQEEPGLYADIRKEALRLASSGEDVPLAIERSTAETTGSSRAREAPAAAATKPWESGFCIACRGSLPLDPAHPYCRECYSSWKLHKDDRREERHCHVCGIAHRSSLARPACYECYRQHKGSLAFAD
jgi:phosphatidylserine/phosphatidylglycerophosphate/cardiolipin synthase-like enzyme